MAATETALAELMTRRLDGLDLVAFMVDGVHYGEHTCVVAALAPERARLDGEPRTASR